MNNAVTLSRFQEWTRMQLARDPRLVARLCSWYEWLATLPRPTRRWLKRKMALTFVAAALLLALGSASIAHAASMTVTPGAAGFADDGKCSLVEAIYNSNYDIQKYSSAGECIAGSGPDTITLPSNATLDYAIAYGPAAALPAIYTPITIEANGTTIQRDNAAGNFAVITVSYGGDLTLNNATISGGKLTNLKAGGGISNYSGILTLNHTTVSGNYAKYGGGIGTGYNTNPDGITTLNDSTISGNSAKTGGGGVNNAASTILNINHSTVSGNTSFLGGGISNYGVMNISDSTVTDNTAYYGGGVYNIVGVFGGNDATDFLTITDSSISGNHAHTDNPDTMYVPLGGGIYNASGIVTVNKSLISGNDADDAGGGVYNGRFNHQNMMISADPGKGKHGLPVTLGKQRAKRHARAAARGSRWSQSAQAKPGTAKPAAPRDGVLPTVNLVNSTVSGNTGAAGAGLYNISQMSLYNVTVSENVATETGGGISNNYYLTLERNLVSGNSAQNFNEIDNCSCHDITADDFNLFGHSGETYAEAFFSFTPGATDISATSDDPNSGGDVFLPTALTDILDTTLGTNGGLTQTHALVALSPAIDKAPDTECDIQTNIANVDQRGFARNVDGDSSPSNNECDIGAYEFASSTAVNLNHLGAHLGRSGNVNVKWRSTSEAQLAGFNVWRKTLKGGWAKVNGKFLQAKHAGDAAGANYRFRDRTALRHPEMDGYKLEIVYLDGHTMWSEVVGVK